MPSDDKPENVEAADRSMQFNLGWYAHPLFKGNYPQVMIDLVSLFRLLIRHEDNFNNNKKNLNSDQNAIRNKSMK